MMQSTWRCSMAYWTRRGGSLVTSSSAATTTTTTTILRFRHSQRQIKRLLKDHPARRRVWDRLGKTPAVPPPPPVTLSPVVEDVTILHNGWTPPPPSTLTIPTYPFAVARTRNKPKDAVGFLPVYSKMRKDGTLATTRIKQVSGDLSAFTQELRAVLQLPGTKRGSNKNNSIPTITQATTALHRHLEDDHVRIRTGGTIEVKGNHVRAVKTWLAGLGF